MYKEIGNSIYIYGYVVLARSTSSGISNKMKFDIKKHRLTGDDLYNPLIAY
jgi:hypothetical protein